MYRTLGAFLMAWATSLSVAARAEPLVVLDFSSDIMVELSGVNLRDDQIGVDDLVNPILVGDLPDVTHFADVDAHSFDADGNDVISLDIAVDLPAVGGGMMFVRDDDVVRRQGAAYEKIFDGLAAGVPTQADVDAVFVHGSDIFLSFDISIAVNGQIIADEDVARWDGQELTLYTDTSALGIDFMNDLDALHFMSTTGALVASFGTGGSVGGITYADDDLLFYDPATGVWSKSYDGTATHANWLFADLDAATPAFDTDGDGEVDREDLCPQFGGNSLLDADGNGIGNDCECGDQTGDGFVNVNDILAINRVIFELEAETPLCDTNDDGLCNVADILGVNAKIFGAPAYCARNPTPVFP